MSLSREQMLIEMGISPIWVRREESPTVAGKAGPDRPAPAAGSVTLAAGREPPAAAGPVGISRIREPVEAPAPEPAVAGEVRPPLTVDAMDWPALQRAVAECRLCPLCEQRRQAVLGVGDLRPDWLFIGEGPGADEDVQGEPFVGQAGKLLDAMLAALDIARGKRVYIANAVKCRPPGNRTPEPAEMAACRPYLARQIELLKPRVIVLLGKAAVHSVLQEDKTLGSMRGQRFEYAGIPVVVTYHPAYLLRNLPDKAKAWEDLLFARRQLRGRVEPELPF